MDTLETQKNFGLWWACHSISRLKSLIQRDSDPKCRNNIVVFTNNNTKHWCKCFDTLSKNLWTQYPPKSRTISEPSTSSFTSSQRNPMFHEVSPPISFSEATAVCMLCIHGRLRLEEPLDHGIVAFAGCLVQRCLASGAAARGKPWAEPNGTKGRKKIKALEIWATQKSSLKFRNIVVLSWLKNHEKSVDYLVNWGHSSQVKMTWIFQTLDSKRDKREPEKDFHTCFSGPCVSSRV